MNDLSIDYRWKYGELVTNRYGYLAGYVSE